MAEHKPINVIIMGAAGRDFHDFNVFYREQPAVPGGRLHGDPDPGHRRPHLPAASWPASSTPTGIPIHAEDELAAADRASTTVDECLMSYSDLPHDEVMHKAALVNAAGADFRMLGRKASMIASHQAGHRRLRRAHRLRQEPDLAPRSTRSSRRWARRSRPSATRCPTATCAKQACQRFAELRRPGEARVHHRGARGVRAAPGDGQHRLRRRRLRARSCEQAEKEADVILWDGGNNDTPVLQARPAHRRRRPAPAGPRGELLPRRDQRPHGRRGRDQQGRHRRPGERRAVEANIRRDQPRARGSSAPNRRSRWTTRRRCAASGCWSSRTARP